MSEQGKDAERLAPHTLSGGRQGMTRTELEVELTAMERAGKIEPEDATEVRRFADYLAAMGQAREDGSVATHGELYAQHYPEYAALAPAPLPKSEKPRSEASEPAPEAAHTDQGAR